MTEKILIFNPKDTPFGPLSNNSKNLVEIDGYIYSTITHYCYSKTLHFPSYIATVRGLQKVSQVAPVAGKLYYQELENTTISALYAAYRERCKSPQIKDLLLSTGHTRLIYLDENAFFGSKIENNIIIGKNMVGIALENIRTELMVEKTKEMKNISRENINDLIYKIYKAYSAIDAMVKTEMRDPEEISIFNLGNEKDPEKQYEKYISMAPGNFKFPEKDIVLNLYNNNKLEMVKEELENPGNLLNIYRRDNFEKIVYFINLKRSSLVFEEYIKYWMEKTFPELSDSDSNNTKEHILKDFGRKLTIDQYKDLRDRVYFLFENGELSERLSDSIDEKLSDYRVPSKSSIKEIVKTELKPSEKEDLSGAIYIRPGELLSPTNTEILMTIENLKIPSVLYYTTLKLFELTGISIENQSPLRTAYMYMLQPSRDGKINFVTLKEYNAIYEKSRDAKYAQDLHSACVKGMTKKFSDISLQLLLLSTGGKELVYTDKNPLLGGKQNFVGNELMRIRAKISTDIKLLKKNINTIEDVAELLIKDNYFKTWVITRFTEICNILGFIHTYFSEKYNSPGTEPFEITGEFLQVFLSKMYSSCYNFMINKIGTEPPLEFKTIINKCSFTKNKQNIFWEYFAGIIFSLVKSTNDPTNINIKRLLTTSQEQLSQIDSCVPKILSGKTDNCIAVSMINILKILRELSELYMSQEYMLDIIDINTAAEILLNREFSFKDTVDTSSYFPTVKKGIKLPNNSYSKPEMSLLANFIGNVDSHYGQGNVVYLADMITWIVGEKSTSKKAKINRSNFFG
jgi:predicted NAD-dependent protein-ADP-ribosyltransferase YbiA (DUF1768 family)